MNVEEIYAFCGSLPAAVAKFPFDQQTLCMTVADKMFAVLPLEKPDIIIVKCDPELAIELRERHAEINPAWHFNKKHWNQIDISGTLPREIIEEQILHSYRLIIAGLTAKKRKELNL